MQSHLYAPIVFSRQLGQGWARPHWRHEDRGASSQCSATAQASARPAKYRPATAQRPYKLRCHKLRPGPSTPVRCASWPGGPTLGTKASSPSASRHSRCWENSDTQPVSSICLTDVAGQRPLLHQGPSPHSSSWGTDGIMTCCNDKTIQA